jgi:hypothetical protein
VGDRLRTGLRQAVPLSRSWTNLSVVRVDELTSMEMPRADPGKDKPQLELSPRA